MENSLQKHSWKYTKQVLPELGLFKVQIILIYK